MSTEVLNTGHPPLEEDFNDLFSSSTSDNEDTTATPDKQKQNGINQDTPPTAASTHSSLNPQRYPQVKPFPERKYHHSPPRRDRHRSRDRSRHHHWDHKKRSRSRDKHRGAAARSSRRSRSRRVSRSRSRATRQVWSPSKDGKGGSKKKEMST